MDACPSHGKDLIASADARPGSVQTTGLGSGHHGGKLKSGKKRRRERGSVAGGRGIDVDGGPARSSDPDPPARGSAVCGVEPRALYPSAERQVLRSERSAQWIGYCFGAGSYRLRWHMDRTWQWKR